MSDISEIDLSKYKLLIFSNPMLLTKEKLNNIQSRIGKDCQIMFADLPGVCAGDFSLDRVFELTGMKVCYNKETATPHSIFNVVSGAQENIYEDETGVRIARNGNIWLLPHSGMLYFFAAIGEYVYKLDTAEIDHNGLGEWGSDAFRVLYSPSCEDLEPFEILYEDGEPAYLEAEAIEFSQVAATHDSFKLLGRPYYDEIAEEYPDHISLLQIDENDDWGLTLYDCGMVVFLVKPEDLKARDWNRVRCYFHSF
jgi:hypothetical protein